VSTDPLTFDKETKTAMNCTECGKDFIALLDYTTNGNHIAECPHCGHEHCRVIVNGKITEDRWSSRFGTDKTKDGIKARRVWKESGDVLAGQTTTASMFIRQRWLEKFQH
jgi:DNA-directed RNA polymerase subunit RPC12/RpoP